LCHGGRETLWNKISEKITDCFAVLEMSSLLCKRIGGKVFLV
jgi:hypothetical protein